MQRKWDNVLKDRSTLPGTEEESSDKGPRAPHDVASTGSWLCFIPLCSQLTLLRANYFFFYSQMCPNLAWLGALALATCWMLFACLSPWLLPSHPWGSAYPASPRKVFPDHPVYSSVPQANPCHVALDSGHCLHSHHHSQHFSLRSI